MTSVIRLHVNHPLGAGQSVPLSREQSHYLFGVMRKGVGEGLELFNGQDGEWIARVVQAGKRNGILLCERQSKPMQLPPDLWLIFAPIKTARTDVIVEKATAMGVAQILPIQSDFTNSERIRQDRLQNHAVEAAGQCGGTYVPAVHELQKLSKLLDGWDLQRQIMFCDETRLGSSAGLPSVAGPWAVLIGQEGGFSPAERGRFNEMSEEHGVLPGPRILSAATAAVEALTLWRSAFGAWQ